MILWVSSNKVRRRFVFVHTYTQTHTHTPTSIAGAQFIDWHRHHDDDSAGLPPWCFRTPTCAEKKNMAGSTSCITNGEHLFPDLLSKITIFAHGTMGGGRRLRSQTIIREWTCAISNQTSDSALAAGMCACLPPRFRYRSRHCRRRSFPASCSCFGNWDVS